MTKKQFTFNRDTVAINLKTPIVYNNEQMSIGEVLEMLNNLYDENEELYEENKRLREILEYGKIDCKHLVSYEEGDYCKKTGDWFFDFEGYEDDCPTCKYCERK